jgi:hypothetical protein
LQLYGTNLIAFIVVIVMMVMTMWSMYMLMGDFFC